MKRTAYGGRKAWPAKKQAGDPAANDAPTASWALSEMRHVQVKEFKGKTLVHIREFYKDAASGELRPGAKGISLNTEQWANLSKIAKEVDAVLAGGKQAVASGRSKAQNLQDEKKEDAAGKVHGSEQPAETTEDNADGAAETELKPVKDEAKQEGEEEEQA